MTDFKERVVGAQHASELRDWLMIVFVTTARHAYTHAAATAEMAGLAIIFGL